MEDFDQRAEAVLLSVFGGNHNWPKIHKDRFGWFVNTSIDLATYDNDLLTRLVLASHAHCVRSAVMPSGPGMIKIGLWPRSGRNGLRHERHPTIMQAIGVTD